MAGLLDLFSGRSSDIYGNGLLTPEQRGGLGNIGLLALAGKLGQLAGPSFSPVPDFGAALGQAAGAYGASQEGAGTAALNAILTGQKGRKLEQELDYYKQLGPVLSKLAGQWPGAGGGTGGGEGAGSTGGGAAAAAGAGGGGADPSEADIIGRESGGKPYVGYGGVDLSNKPLNEFGFPIWEGRMGPAGISHAAGLYQFQPSTWATYAGPLGIKDFSPESQRKVYLAARAAEGARPWAASAGGGGGRAAPAPTAAAPAPAGGGGLLAPTAPNPLSDAEPMLPIARPRVGPQAAAVGPQAPAIGDGYSGMSRPGRAYIPFLGGDIPAGSGAGTPGQGAASEEPPPGFAGRQLVAQLLARPPVDDLSQYRQVAGPGAADAAAAPRAPLPTMGPAGIELPPMQGPLAAPAPAAAAPAAPGPGLLSPGALPGTAAAIPRGANPAYDAFLKNAFIADTLARGAGLPPLGLTEALKASPGYAAELERAKQRIETEFAGPKAEAAKAVELRYAESLAAAAARGNLPSQIILKTVEAQNQFKNSMGPLGLQATFDKDGNASVSDLPGFKENAPAAAGAIESAKPTPEMKNYDAYVKDAQMRNQPVLSRYDWERTKGSPDPDKAGRIALDLTVAEPLAAQAAAGVQAKPLLDEVVRLAYQTPEGMAGEGSAAAGKLMAAFGFAPTDRMSNAELLTGVQQRLIGPIREPGTSSDRDVSRYLLATPGLMSTGDGRVKMAEMTKALIDRNNELATVYRNNLGSPDLQSKLAIVHNKPLFSDEQRAAIDETIRTRGGTVPGGVTPGERVPAATAPPASVVQPRIIQGPDGYKIEKNGQWVPYTPPGTVPMGR